MKVFGCPAEEGGDRRREEVVHKLVQYKKTNLKEVYNLASSYRIGKVSTRI
jgi:hypothetical protein